MSTKTIKIRNMCCGRCIMAVKQVFDQLGIKQKKVELGYAEIYSGNKINDSAIEKALVASGFEVIKTNDEKIAENISIAIRKIFFEAEIDFSNFNLRTYLESNTALSYKKLAEIFKKQNHNTIENCFIAHRIEKTKVMIDDTDHSFSEIAYKVGYKSLSHLSRQFREVEGCSMHDYKLKHHKNRKFIDKL